MRLWPRRSFFLNISKKLRDGIFGDEGMPFRRLLIVADGKVPGMSLRIGERDAEEIGAKGGRRVGLGVEGDFFGFRKGLGDFGEVPGRGDRDLSSQGKGRLVRSHEGGCVGRCRRGQVDLGEEALHPQGEEPLAHRWIGLFRNEVGDLKGQVEIAPESDEFPGETQRLKMRCNLAPEFLVADRVDVGQDRLDAGDLRQYFDPAWADPGTPGMLSEASPVKARRSGIFFGGTP